MDNRASPTRHAARPKNSSSSITSSSTTSHAQAGAQPLNMSLGSRTARGSTPTASRSATKLDEADKPTRAASRDSLKQKMLKKDEAPRPSRSEEVRDGSMRAMGRGQTANAAQQLKVFKTEFDSLRTHLTCKICDRLLYQPYTISCGHTYCYTVRPPRHICTQSSNMFQCLCTWFVSNKARKTCPDCRIVVKDLPAPAYVVSQAG
jgi:hypothetical protein